MKKIIGLLIAVLLFTFYCAISINRIDNITPINNTKYNTKPEHNAWKTTKYQYDAFLPGALITDEIRNNRKYEKCLNTYPAATIEECEIMKYAKKYDKCLNKHSYVRWELRWDICKKVIDRPGCRVNIGMSYEELAMRCGKPDSINESNYGNGNRYQYCWYEYYRHFCAYDNDNDNIIDAYN